MYQTLDLLCYVVICQIEKIGKVLLTSVPIESLSKKLGDTSLIINRPPPPAKKSFVN